MKLSSSFLTATVFVAALVSLNVAAVAYQGHQSGVGAHAALAEHFEQLKDDVQKPGSFFH